MDIEQREIEHMLGKLYMEPGAQALLPVSAKVKRRRRRCDSPQPPRTSLQLRAWSRYAVTSTSAGLPSWPVIPERSFSASE